MADISTAPWTVEQVQHLNWQQHRKNMHPFTCPQCRDNLGIYYLIDDGMRLRRASDDEWTEVTREAREAFEKDVDPIAELLGLRERTVILERELVATVNGWICPTCDYTQNWCHEAMLP